MGSGRAVRLLKSGQLQFNRNFLLTQNEVNDAETEKFFYKNKLQSEYRTHTCEMEELYAIVSQKNDALLHLEECIDKIKKDYRMLEDECSCMRKNSASDK